MTFKIEIKVAEYSIRNDLIRWQRSPSIKVILEHFSLALTVFEILKILALENVGQGHAGENRDLHCSMA